MVAKHIVLASALMATLFFSALAHAESKCLTLVCNSDQLSRKILSAAELSSLPVDTQSQLQSKVQELSNVWADTILEGDYFADEAVRMDRIVELSRSGAVVGYYVTYSAKAWDTSTCEFDYEDLSTLASCDAGRIVESGYISADFHTILRDTAALAEFKKGSR